MTEVTLQGVRKSFGDVHIIKGVDLAIEEGEFCVFVGPSGCGKSTLLRLVAGLEEMTGGTLKIGGKDMTHTPPANRGVAMVFQSYALYPHMTVGENIGFGLKMANRPRAEIEQRVQKAAAMLQLGHLLDRKPAQLSGGQRQRVAIGRAIVREPGVFLFDEPLSNLDAALRVQTRIEISKLHQELGSTMIYVTHDQVEAMTMADKIVVLQGGIIEQVGSPLELYHRPRNIFVAGFIGSPKMNFLPVVVTGVEDGIARLTLPGATMALPTRGATVAPGIKATLGVRPEHMSLGDGHDGTLVVTTRLAERLGAETMLYVDAVDGTPLTVRADGLARTQVGEKIAISLDAPSCHLFDESGHTLVNGSLI
jgi:multiple sugar transport system ATP-binding protein